MTVEDQDTSSIEQALLKDRHRLRKLWRAIQSSKNETHGDRPKFDELLRKSLDTVATRKASRPEILFDLDLPILAHREEIAELLHANQVLVVSGETGSGKSTQLPKICLDAGFGVQGLIGHTQPRRIAARTIANRLASELKQTLGHSVGFKIRFADKTSESTLIKLMTDGILLAETQTDRFLEKYEVIIIDEAHERSLNIDFLLGMLKQMLSKRPELKLIITSATIDAERFSRHFSNERGPAPALEVSGRTYPVETRYRPLQSEDKNDRDSSELNGIVDGVQELAAEGHGNILIFLPTERDIRETANRLRKENFPGGRFDILPLYARLSSAEQNKVFQTSESGKGRRIILATNVAESSLTVPGIRYVIDTGTARISRYSPRSKVQRLPIESVSRASADQRKGRCGRIGPGICIRLFDEEDFDGRNEFTTPEIQRTNLASVILQAKTLRLGRVEDFPFLDPPPPESIRDGYRTLFEIGAVDEDNQLTKLGKRLSRFPVDPRIARIILAADEYNCLSELLIIAAAMEIQDPRERPVDKQQQADMAHEQFVDEQSDFMSYLKLWDFYHQLKESVSNSKLRRACQRNFLSYNRMREWTEIRRQLAELAKSNRLVIRTRKDDYDDIHRALLTGFLSGVAFRSGDYEYNGAGGVKFHLWPGSGLFATKPTWCLVQQLIETTRRYGRTVAEIKPSWVEHLSRHVSKTRHDEPHFHRKSGRVMAYETITLFGLPIVTRRRVPYGPINPTVASEVFVREGLAKQQLDCSDRFYAHNEKIIRECMRLAAKTRRADYLVDEYTLYQFYNDRLPVNIYDLMTLRKWLKESATHRRSLELTLDDLLADKPGDAQQKFPDQLAVGSLNIPIDYSFAPGNETDGANITVPIDALAQLDANRLAWGVPGQIEERIVALIRSLPKSIRRGLIPAPDVAKAVSLDLQFGRGDFFREVRSLLSKKADEKIPADAFDLTKIPSHLQLNIRVVDDKGELAGQSRDLSNLRSEFGVTANTEINPTADQDTDSEWHRDGLTAWEFNELPKKISIHRNDIELDAFPTVVDDKESVKLRLLNSAEMSRRQSRSGIRRLYTLKQKKALRSQVSWLPEFEEVCVLAAPVISRDELTDQVRDLISDRAFFQRGEKLPRDQADFESRLENAAERIGMATQDVAKVLPRLFKAFHAVRLAMEEHRSNKWSYATEDVNAQIEQLLTGKFLTDTPWLYLEQFPRYFKAIAYRMERLSAGALDRDRAATEEIAASWQQYLEQSEADTLDQIFNAELTTYRWMLEEYRVSCFAQPLGTMFSISDKRLEKQWAKVVK